MQDNHIGLRPYPGSCVAPAPRFISARPTSVAPFGPPGLDVRRGPRFTSSDLVLRAAAEGRGVALARHRLAIGDVTNGALVRPRGDRAVLVPDAYWLVVRTHGRSQPAIAEVLAWLRSATR
jgi:LysR family glycine cleavage system transcriptional activator